MNLVNKVVKFLDGKKTLIVALATAVYNVLVAFHVISANKQLAINGILAGGYVGALRLALKKIDSKLPAPVATAVEAEVAKVV